MDTLPVHRTDRTKLKQLVGALGLILLLVLTWLPDFDAAADDYLSHALTDNLVIYASARTINAVISVIQSFEVSLSLGAGFALNPGEALDPLNDLIERFSGFVLYGLAALGLQQVMLIASSSLLSKILISAAALGIAVSALLGLRINTIFKRLICLLLLVRFALLIEVGISWGLDQLYFNQQQIQASTSLDLARDRLQGVRAGYMQVIEEQGFFGGARESLLAIMGTDEEQGITDLAAGAIIQLIVIMLIKSLLLPLGFIWLLWKLVWSGRWHPSLDS
jgi:hypothetical protein